MQRAQAYFKNYLLILLLGLLLIAGINLIIDPQNFFPVVNREGFNREKPFLTSSGMRKLKSIELEKGDYNTILLGTSRVLQGLNPVSPTFESGTVYNAGLPRANLYEIYKVSEFSRNHQKLKTIIIGLDFLSFSGENNVAGDFNHSRFVGRNLYKIYLDGLISNQQLFHSIETLNFNLHKNSLGKSYTRYGSVTVDPSRILYETIFKEQLKRFLKAYAEFDYSQEKLDLFRQLVKDCQANNINLYVFISPIHVQLLEVIRIVGLYPTYEQWQRDLVNILSEETGNASTVKTVLWDFSGYNSITTESLPSSTSKRPMLWYYDSSHYNQAVGELILQSIFSPYEKSQIVPSDFGVVLTPETVESHLAQIRDEQVLYRQNHFQVVAAVVKLAQKEGLPVKP